VQDVTVDGSANKAGVKKGDVIDKVNGVEVNSVSNLQEIIGKYRPGDKVTLMINRKGEIKELTATLKGIDGKETPTLVDNSNVNVVKGATLVNLTKEEKEKLGIKNGVKIQSIGSGPFKGKLQPGFVITKIDKQVIYSIQNVKNILENAEGAILIEGKNADGSDNVVGLKIDK
jgi:serine protease Do